ncbi:hypothetical protein FB45DRAFT_897204 [Roridomyces roridus]|uniref:Alpha/gamma-adaptin-binding protein p34 n=1 Tax=Roridomyces roridus TaxID=1738132 RepID=A0AAD7CB44_9AGAR|nr:hypothetical protein FB45DRAFT_897204 [Roridomyces roridus]
MSTDSIVHTSEISPDSPLCRILAVSASLDRAVALIGRIQALNPSAPLPADADPAPPEQPEIESASAESSPPALGASTRIPWTLSNKYYSAAVHFAVHTVTGLSPHTVREAPAVLFVWGKGGAYKDHIARLAGDMRGAEPEVALAVRVASDGEKDEEQDDEEETDVDEFLSEHGFEFVDVSEEQSSRDEGPFGQDNPGLPRVLDALSTIMWPSMVASPSKTGLKNKRNWEWARGSLDNDDDPAPSPPLFHSRREEEMKELSHWLENEDPWRSAEDTVTSPIEVPSMEGWNESVAEEGKEGGFGFDDDFTVFVSAPPAEDESFDADAWDDEGDSAQGLQAHKLYNYSSLGSAQDLTQGAEEWASGSKRPEDEEDAELPTDAEVEAMSARIFGLPLEADEAGGDSGEYHMAPFDLSRVMSALEGMKAEIAGMTDEEERRKAAAQVALGLVYGLESDESANVDTLNRDA